MAKDTAYFNFIKYIRTLRDAHSTSVWLFNKVRSSAEGASGIKMRPQRYYKPMKL
jgi:hypothetical protein